ncbi:MAG TPA: DNA polymerase III subunit delta [Candidatus Saccharibacteria bacterium]|nr:DNA polymerase III subunit delta [Candidatus Saccharibacteria bacterium]
MITSITGNNAYAINARLAEIKDNFVKDHGALNLERLDGGDATYEQIIDSVTNTSLFSEKKLVIVENIEQNKELTDDIDNFLSRIAGTDVVFVLRSPDKRSKLYKVINKQTELLEFNLDNNIGLDRWVIDEVKKRGGAIDMASAKLLIEKTGIDQAKLSNEVDKLLAYHQNITKDNIQLLTISSPQSTIFQLLETAFSGNYPKTLTIYEEQRAQKVEPIAILGMIIWQLHIFATIKFSNNLSSSDIAKQAKINPYVVDKSRSALSKISRPYLKKLINQVARLDVSLKSDSIDSDNALKSLLLNISEAVS